MSTPPNAIVEVRVNGAPAVRIGNAEPLSIIAGPCAMESRQHALETAHALKEIAERRGVGLIYKTSFDKANRTSIERQRGVGLGQALPVFAEMTLPSRGKNAVAFVPIWFSSAMPVISTPFRPLPRGAAPVTLVPM